MKSIEDLKKIRENMQQTMNMRQDVSEIQTKVVVGMATCGIAAGARTVLSALVEGVAENNLEHIMVTQTGCNGMCSMEPIVNVITADGNWVTYVKMTPEKAKRVVVEHLAGGNIVEAFTVGAAK